MIKSQHRVILALASFFIENYLIVRGLVRSIIATFGGIFILLMLLGIVYYFITQKTVVEAAYEPSKEIANKLQSLEPMLNPSIFLDKANIIELLNQYCSSKNIDDMICRCTLIPAYQDFSARFTPQEIYEMQGDRGKMLYETAISLKNTRNEGLRCLEAQKDKASSTYKKVRTIYELLYQQ